MAMSFAGRFWRKLGLTQNPRVDERLVHLQEEISRQATELVELRRRLATTSERPLADTSPVYDEDYLAVWNKNLPFLSDERFKRAYAAGMNTGHNIGGGGELFIRWRLHVLCWAATHAACLEGDFVECGVNTGIFSMAVMTYLDFQDLPKRFFLFDTFSGVPDHQFTQKEVTDGRRVRYEEYYQECYTVAQRNFSPFHNAVLIRGEVPTSLTTVDIDRVAYLSIDMNIAFPEIHALKFFWTRLVPGAVVVLDDYAWYGHEEQQSGVDEFAKVKGTGVLTLPTGQGLLLKY